MPEKEKYEDGWTDTEKVNGGQSQQAVVNTPPQERGIYNVGITYDQVEQTVGLPTPTTDDEGKVLKVDAEGKWALSTDAEGTVVVANPTLAGTEADLTGLQVGSTKYKVEQPINVVANPTLAGTESQLTGLEVGTTKYKIPEGVVVVELSASSGTLSDSDYAKVSGDNCLILYNNVYYEKVQDDGTAFYYLARRFNEQYYYISQSGFQINYSKDYFQSSGISFSEVIANPTLDGTESSLTGIQVGSTKYSAGGTKLYKHDLNLTCADTHTYEVSILYPSNAQLNDMSIFPFDVRNCIALKKVGSLDSNNNSITYYEIGYDFTNDKPYVAIIVYSSNGITTTFTEITSVSDPSNLIVPYENVI